jgi:hypothetical protein
MMRGWKLTIREPHLDELLADEMMVPVTRSAGLDRTQLRAMLAQLARRLPPERLTPRRDCASAPCREPAGA